ncbi:MAG: hypothetical protein J6L69_04525 [Lachnospiraceae bacterium]|nr:hypothetical protein [Lachnospiraceae bacterium]
MKKCETEKEYAKGISCVLTIAGVPLMIFFIFSILSADLNIGDKVGIIAVFTVIFLIMEIVYLLMWYPYLSRKKKALALGKVYDGKIISINYRKKAKWLVLRHTNYFTLTVQYKDKIVKKFNEDVYIGGPMHYIPRNKECKVYEYRGKVYMQEFPYIEKNEFSSMTKKVIENHMNSGNLRDVNMMKQVQAMVEPEKYLASINLINEKDRTCTKKEELFEYSNDSIASLSEEDFEKALLERECIPMKFSNAHILTPAFIISKDGKRAYVFVELSINSSELYCYEDVGYFVDVCKYLNDNADLYFNGNREEFISKLKLLVEKHCNNFRLEKEDFELKQVLVSVRDIK